MILLLSATPTAIFAAAWLAALGAVFARHVRVQAIMHGNLNDAFGWRTRNPVTRAFDLFAALKSRHGGRVQIIVLERAIRDAVLRRLPDAEDRIRVIPHPVDPTESTQYQPEALALPLRIGLVGQANEAKGITQFLSLAAQFRASDPEAVHCFVVGNPRTGTDLTPYAALHEPPQLERFTRADFVKGIARLHYVCLPLQERYYELSASGALLDAVNWLKPVIALRVPIVAELFEQYGDIGELCDDMDAMRTAVAALVRCPDPERYRRQIANLTRAREARVPLNMASYYRAVVNAAFGQSELNSHISQAIHG